MVISLLTVSKLTFDGPRQHLGEQSAARRGVVTLDVRLAVLAEAFPAELDLGVNVDHAILQRVLDLGDVAEHLRLHITTGLANDREVVETEHDVLRRHDDRRAVGGVQDVVGGHHEHARFELRLKRQRNVHSHLVAVEVGIERRANQRVKLDRLAFDQHRLERLDAEAV